MIEFKKLTLADKNDFLKFVNESDADGSAYSFGTVFCWAEAYSVEIAYVDSFLVVSGYDSLGRYYAYPLGKGDKTNVIRLMLEDCRERGEMFRMEQLMTEDMDELLSLFPDLFYCTYDRNACEYVYSVQDMASLQGKRFHGKKGHINAFFKNHTDISCDPISKDNINDCIAVAEAWLDGKADNVDLYKELNAIKIAVENFEALGFTGAVLYADGKAVAFTMGESLKNNTFCTHYEKTLPEYRDAYPVINNGFTKLMLMSYDFVNREEDLGQEGLRKAKLSYHPELLLNKYSVILKSDSQRKFSVNEEDKPQLIYLWKTVFGDSDDVINYFLSHVVSLKDIFAYKTDGKIVSAFYLVDAPLKKTDGTERKMKYLYAAATLPRYRTRGIMTEMIEYASVITELSEYEGISLYPAEEKLYAYYSKFGFASVFRIKKFKIKKSQIECYSGCRYFNTQLDYYEMRQNAPAERYVDFSLGYLDFIEYCTMQSGFLKTVIFDDEDKVYITGSEEDGVLYVTEAFSSQMNVGHILSVLADTDFSEFELSMPYDIFIPDFEARCEVGGMLLDFSSQNNKNLYLGQTGM